MDRAEGERTNRQDSPPLGTLLVSAQVRTPCAAQMGHHSEPLVAPGSRRTWCRIQSTRQHQYRPEDRRSTNSLNTQAPWHVSVALATWEAEAEVLQIRGQTGQLGESLSQNEK